MLNNFEKFSFPSIEKKWTKDKETDGQKETRTTNVVRNAGCARSRYNFVLINQ